MKDVYCYIPETNDGSRLYKVAVIVLFTIQYVVDLMLFPMVKVLYVCTFRSVCAVPSMAFFVVPECAFQVYYADIF
jgi:hypothetical protein